MKIISDLKNKANLDLNILNSIKLVNQLNVSVQDHTKLLNQIREQIKADQYQFDLKMANFEKV